MSISELKEKVLESNLNLVKDNLVISTWGNVSGYDDETGLIGIKASGVPYDKLTLQHIVIMDINGKIQAGCEYRPSTDTPTHLMIYRKFKEDGIRGVTHTHSKFATMWAQSGLNIPCLGTTHADYFGGDIPCTRLMSKEEINSNYEENTGKVILEAMEGKSCIKMSAVLVHSHAPFVWGKSPEESVLHSLVLEYIAEMAFDDYLLCNGTFKKIQPELAEKHYKRKFGPNAYYGQIKKD